MIFSISCRMQFEAEGLSEGENLGDIIRDSIKNSLPTVGRLTSWNFNWNEPFDNRHQKKVVQKEVNDERTRTEGDEKETAD